MSDEPDESRAGDNSGGRHGATAEGDAARPVVFGADEDAIEDALFVPETFGSYFAPGPGVTYAGQNGRPFSKRGAGQAKSLSGGVATVARSRDGGGGTGGRIADGQAVSSGVTVNPQRPMVRGTPLVDLGVRPLTPDSDYWNARVRAAHLERYIIAGLEGQGLDAIGQIRELWREFGVTPRNGMTSLAPGYKCGVTVNAAGLDVRHAFGPVAAVAGSGALRGTTLSLESGNPFRLSGGVLRAMQSLRAAAMRLSLRKRPADGFCQRGHALTDENRRGKGCRTCQLASYRATRNGRTIEEELAHRAERDAARQAKQAQPAARRRRRASPQEITDHA